MKISVCIATYNGAKYIREQILSILPQLKETDEIIISDDGSIDQTISVIKLIDDKRIKLFFNTKQHGVVSNFENALINTTGDYIFLSDQDDVWAENKVEMVCSYLKTHSLVIHNVTLMNAEGQLIGGDFFKASPPQSGYFSNLYKNNFMGSCMAFHRLYLDYILPFPKLILWHDMWIGLSIELRGNTKFINDKLLYYRRHGNNTSTTSEKSTFSMKFKLKYRMQMLYYTLLYRFFHHK